MARGLSPEFVENRIHTLTHVPVEWSVDLRDKYYELDLKMSQMKMLVFNFKWGDESGPLPRLANITDTPSRILKLDLSLNELIALEHEGLLPFKQVRELNASLNRINKFIGIEVLKNLHSLDLSHNSINKIENLVGLSSLVILNLSMNELEDISYMPSMVSLKVLNLNNNHLKSLDGVQALPKLTELSVQRNNITNILPLTSCFHLQILNAASNKVNSLHTTVGVLTELKRLEVIAFHGNPIEREKNYQTDILRSSNVMTLDNISVRPLPKENLPSYDAGSGRHVQNIETLKDAAKQAFQERMKESKGRMEENVNFLQRRIIDLQNEYVDYENKLKTDLDACVRYLDSLTASEVGGVDHDQLRGAIGTPNSKPWHRRKEGKPDYGGIKDTDELLKATQKELLRQTPGV
ncbi:uncharacterized protein [Mytilus edulis]|uniref:uncharacterized protein n=1 Tax=Mytilus edulis TaxID=6550 RepID=UPI0039F096A9